MIDLITAEEATKLLADHEAGLLVGVKAIKDAAPDLARQLLATMDALTEAQAAQAGVVERCLQVVASLPTPYNEDTMRGHEEAYRALESLADPTGVKLLAELRAERDAALQAETEYRRKNHALTDERDRLAAANAALEAKVAELEGLEGAAAQVLRYITNPDWADGCSEAFKTMPWNALYRELRKDAGDFPAIVRSYLEAFTDDNFRAALASGKPGEAGNG